MGRNVSWNQIYHISGGTFWGSAAHAVHLINPTFAFTGLALFLEIGTQMNTQNKYGAMIITHQQTILYPCPNRILVNP